MLCDGMSVMDSSFAFFWFFSKFLLLDGVLMTFHFHSFLAMCCACSFWQEPLDHWSHALHSLIFAAVDARHCWCHVLTPNLQRFGMCTELECPTMAMCSLIWAFQHCWSPQ